MSHEMKIIAIDVETIADVRCLEFLPEIKKKEPLKGHIKVKEDIIATVKEIDDISFIDLTDKQQAAKNGKLLKLRQKSHDIKTETKQEFENRSQKQIADMGMKPEMNMICVAGYYDNEGNSGAIILENESGEAEEKLLLEYWEVLSNYDQFVTFNGRGFDMPSMLLHGMKYGIRPSVNIDNGRYNRQGSNHIDLYKTLTADAPFAKGKLEYFARMFLGVGKTEGMDGKLVQSYWDMGLKNDIAKYCIDDCEITMNLYKMAVVAGMVD